MKSVAQSHRSFEPGDAAGRLGGRGFAMALMVALLLHALVIFFTIAGFRRQSAQQIDWIELMPEGLLVGGSSLPAPVPAAEETPAMEQAPPQPVTVPEPAPEPVRHPEPVANPEAIRLPEPKAATPKPPPITPAQKKKAPIKVNLKEVTRPTAAPRVAPIAPANEPVLDAQDIRERLQKRLGRTNVSGTSAEGVSGIPGGTGSGEVAAYYALIRDVYYQAWKQPVFPGRERLNATARVTIARDGRILAAVMETASGNAQMDDTVNAAVAMVKAIGRPLPSALGSQSAQVTITFEF